MANLSEMTWAEQLAYAAEQLDAVATICEQVRGNIPAQLILDRLGDPAAQLAANSGLHLRTVATALRSFLPPLNSEPGPNG
jgi:hypothetical protein